MAMVASTSIAYHKPRLSVVCRKKDRDRELEREKEHKYPFKVVEITPPPRCLGVRCFPTAVVVRASVRSSRQQWPVLQHATSSLSSAGLYCSVPRPNPVNPIMQAII
ncbi:uncharacterized protein LOC119364662 isoform X2 [Triticum dicoccoides]|uniref:uncharacterized protein LOC119364662 isoform X2 n=1 Tax=Triticum dicoccoides TaxID=85692 RepID=UPI00188FDE81|nr:uncharacterized protein LOC119364662 isoform X2 [Triticum dicoccoides]